MIARLLSTLPLTLALLVLPLLSQAQDTTVVNPVPKLLKNLDSPDGRISAAAARSLGTIFRDRDTNTEFCPTVR